MMKTLFNFKLISLLLLTALCFTQCKKDDPEDPKSTEAKMLSFTIGELAGTIANDKTITFKEADLAAGYDLTKLSPTIAISEAATVSPASGAAQDFSGEKEISYTVTSEDGKTSTVYKVKVVEKPSNDASLTSINIPTDPTAEVIIATKVNTNGEYEVSIGIKEGTDIKSINMDFTLAAGAVADEDFSINTGDFSDTLGVKIVVTAQDGTTTKTYRIIIKVQPDVIELRATDDDVGVFIDKENRMIHIVIGTDADITAVNFESITVSEGAKVTDIITAAQNLTTNQSLTVTGAGVSVTYTISAKKVAKLTDGGTLPVQIDDDNDNVRGGIGFLGDANTIVIGKQNPRKFNITDLENVSNESIGTGQFSLTVDDIGNLVTNNLNLTPLIYWTKASGFTGVPDTIKITEGFTGQWDNIEVVGDITGTATVYAYTVRTDMTVLSYRAVEIEIVGGAVMNITEHDIDNSPGTGSITKKVDDYLLVSSNDDEISVYSATDFTGEELYSRTLNQNEGGANVFTLNGNIYMSVVDRKSSATLFTIYDLSVTGYTDLIDQLKATSLANIAYQFAVPGSTGSNKNGNTEVILKGNGVRILYSMGNFGAYVVDLTKE